MSALPTTEGNTDLKSILEFLWRRKLAILAPTLVMGSLIALFVLYLPNLYRSSISIFIEPQKVPQDYVRSTVTTDIQTRIRTISQQLTSRSRLVQVIKELDLYPEGIPKGWDPVIEKMSTDLTVEVPNKKEDSLFMVHFVHRDPVKAQAAVSRLVSLFIDESLQVREEQAAGTTQFIEEEMQKLKVLLEQQESAIKSFRQNNIGELPGQMDANLRMLDNLHLQLSENQKSQRELEARVILLEQDISRLETALQTTPVAVTSRPDPRADAFSQLLLQRDALQKQIAQMESTYTDRHPDLVNARKELAQLDEKITLARKEMTSAAADPVVVANPSSLPESARELAGAKRQLNETKPRLGSLYEEEKSLKEKITLYQQRVERAPRREQELLALTRDYENTKKNYEGLLNKKLDAQLSENLEKRQKGERFRILDPANLPERPISPNRPKLILLAYSGSLGLGLALSFLLETLFPAYHDVNKIREKNQFALVYGIPHLDTPKERRKRRTRWILRIVISLLVISLFLLLIHFLAVPLPKVYQAIKTNLMGQVI